MNAKTVPIASNFPPKKTATLRGVDNDRRKVFIATVPDNIAKVGKFYEHMQRAMLKDWETYSDAELRLLLRFMTQGYKTMLAATEQLKTMMEAPKARRAGATSRRPDGPWISFRRFAAT